MSQHISAERDESAPPSTKSTTELRGQLGVGSILFSVVAWAAPLLVVVGLMPSMIAFGGSGIIAALAVSTVILLLFSVGYAAVTRYVERPGAFYAYITAGLGKDVGLGGAFLAMSGYLVLLLSTWAAFGVYGRQLVVDTFHGPDLPWYLYGIAGAGLAGVAAYRKIEFSAKTLGVALILEVVLVLVFNLRVFFDGGPDGPPLKALSWDGASTGNFGLVLLFAMLCFGGFESSAIYREEAKDPNKTIPRATYVAVVLIGVFYLVAAWAMLTALGSEGVADARAGGAVASMFGDLAAAYVGNVVPGIINVLVISSTFACLLAQHNAVARYAYSLGKDGVLPRTLGVAHARHHSPFVASLIVSALEVAAVVIIAAATALDSAGTDAFTVYIRLNGLGAIVVVALLVLVSAAVLAYFKVHKVPGRGVWKTTIAPGIALASLGAVLILSFVNVDALIGAGFLASLSFTLFIPLVWVGGIAYARWLKKSKPAVYEKIGRQ
ncbi:APC family permease [Arthrobacter cupressi]|uniref:Amino acid transporter n=1 Tax=Arthrobacter cupressi TaxID=1045773 RepID=A0A1G8LHH0_9MICC|nr:APC family permease [Arthrobacter cupressi]NYD77622.1 amino acid transporter [Arthrobacter cupressi]SDI55154.1 Amino acid transporter [Arthrobacter cupressi]